MGSQISILKIAAKKIGISYEEYLRKIKKEKWCIKCRKWKSKKEFSKDNSRTDKLKSSCLSCNRTRPSNFKPKTQNEKYNKWYKTKGAVSVRQRNYARKRKLFIISAEIYNEIMNDFENKCAYCQKEARTLDHLFPVKMGGNSHPSNLVPACVSCNSSKGKMDLFKWAKKKKINLSEKIFDKLSLAEINGNGYYEY